MRALPLVLLGLLPFAGAFGQTAPAGSAGAITGTVRDSAGAPVAAAEVTIAALSRRATADAAGRFRLEGVPLGQQVVSARRIGFRRRELSVIVEAGRVADASFVLGRLAQQLNTVTVEAPRSRRARYLAGFYDRRRRAASGRFLTQDQIDDRNATTLPELLTSSVPGVRIVSSRSVLQGVRLRGQSCAPLVWLDGAPAPAAEFDLSTIHPSTVSAVEVYSSGSLVPGEFQLPRGAHACGVVAIWSRMWDGDPAPRRKRRSPSLDSALAELRVYDASEVDEPAQADSATLRAPAYPDSLYAFGVAGEAVLEFVVDTTGEVRESSIGVLSATHDAFAQAARRSLLASRFRPAKLQGRKVPQVVLLPFRFQLTEGRR